MVYERDSGSIVMLSGIIESDEVSAHMLHAYHRKVTLILVVLYYKYYLPHSTCLSLPALVVLVYRQY